MGLYINNLIV